MQTLLHLGRAIKGGAREIKTTEGKKLRQNLGPEDLRRCAAGLICWVHID